MDVVVLSQKGEVKQAKLKVQKGKVPTAESFATVLKKKEIPSILGRYSWKGKTLTLLGYDEGKAGTENQIHLFPPLEGMTFYGDILVVCTSEPNNYATLQPFRDSDYESFYTNKMEGEEDEDGEVEEQEEVVEEAIVDDEAELSESDEEGEYGDEEEEQSEVKGEDEDGDGEEDDDEDIRRVSALTKVQRVRKVVAAPIEEPEVDFEEVVSDATPHRQHMLKVIDSLIPLTQEQKAEFEKLIFQAAIHTSKKEHIRASWVNKSFGDVYSAIARRILGNLSPTSYVKNVGLWERFRSGEVTLAQLVNQNSYEMYPDVWQQMVDRQAKKERTQLEGDFSRATDKWQCNGCKMRKCTYYELQTRSADEPMTVFIQCLNCNKRWTQ